MELFKPKKIIPPVGVAVLTLGACGGNSGGGSIEGAIKKVCEKNRLCNRTEFESEFSSISDCVAYYTDYINSSNIEPDCRKAAIALINCTTSKLTCSEWYYDYEAAELKCGPQTRAVSNACSYEYTYD